MVGISAENNTFLVKNGVLRKYQADSGAEGQYHVDIPNNITSVGKEAFRNRNDIASVTIPETVVSIGNEAFSYCHNLKRITIPARVTSIGKQVFAECGNLTICAPAGSYAETYAVKNKIPFIAE